MVIVAGTAKVEIADWDAAMAHISQMIAATEAEPECISYRMYVDPNDRSTFFIFEEWASEAGLAQHFRTEHIAAFSAFLQSIKAQMHIKRYSIDAVSEL